MAPPEGSHRRCGNACCGCCPCGPDRWSVCGVFECLCGCELTTRDFLRLLPCLLWCFVSIISSVLHVVIPVCSDRFPATMPIFWGWLSALPAFVCAVLIMLYHRDATQEHGFSQETAKCFGAFYGFLSILGCFVYLTFVISAVVMVVQCNPIITVDGLTNCDPGNFGYNAFWFFMTITWLIFQSCLTPRARFVEELVSKHQQLQAAGGGANLSFGPGHGGGYRPSMQGSTSRVSVIHPTVYGNPAAPGVYETPMVYGSPTEMTGPTTYAKNVEASS
ncbi:transmembrane protein [Cystoisospora suis]|uniref:Transmembrane protein n=1 Tax=Cystoisospora suis TaxID=483139 RepID=A0A2C6KNJ2_9APIC|nr:transmembrane protein [Cystoisospora suis]